MVRSRAVSIQLCRDFPRQVVQALAGDSADNVPGVPGIGVKTAALLINEYGDLDGVLDRAAEIKQPKRRQNLIDYADLARISRQLVTLKNDVPVDLGLEDLLLKDPQPDVLFGFMEEMELGRLAGRIAQRLGGELPTVVVASEAEQPESTDYECIQTLKELEPWIDLARSVGNFLRSDPSSKRASSVKIQASRAVDMSRR